VVFDYGNGEYSRLASVEDADMSYSKRVDANQPQIVKDLRSIGAYVKSVHIVPEFLDIIVVFRGVVYLAEIKNPDNSPKTKPVETMLTDGEAEAKALIEAAGGIYHIWLTTDQAFKAIGAA